MSEFAAISAVILLAVLPTAEELRGLPDVAEVTVQGSETATKRIVHVLNWHFVTREEFGLEADETGYEQFLRDVERLQQAQMELLGRIKVRRVRYEGLTADNRAAYFERARTIKKLNVRGDTPTEQLIAGFIHEDTLQLGAPGRLWMSGELEDVLPGDDAACLERANPVKNGKVVFDPDASKKRDDAIARLLLSEHESVIILGGGHDLAKHLPADVQYIRVALRQYKQAAVRTTTRP